MFHKLFSIILSTNSSKKWKTALFFLLLSPISFCQTVVAGDFTHFSISTKKDTIDFIIAETDFLEKKPILLFCQGSQPVPLFIELENEEIWNTCFNNFDISQLKKDYHLVCISMPKTPLIAKQNQLNTSFAFITNSSNPNSFLKDFFRADFLENYTRRANKVLKFLRKQKWTEKSKLVVFGHSQGAKIALDIASKNKKVSQLGLFGYNPTGRIDQIARQARKDAETGKITWEEADSITQKNLEFFERVNNEEYHKKRPQYIPWKSFSTPTIDKLLKIEIPIYIAYGSQDIIADFCDILPFYFVEHKKNNLTLKRYPNLNHNFFEVENGIINYKKRHWKAVINDFLDWGNNSN